MLAPGKLVSDQVSSFWNRYLYFVGIRQQNDQLLRELTAAKEELSGLRENASEVERLRRLLSMTPPGEWTRQGARIISHRLGPNAALETFLIDKGSAYGVTVNTPVVSPDGVVGRVLRISPTAATILLVTDPNSRIPVVSQKNRTQGILKGEGPTRELVLQYVPQDAPMEEGEVLVTSGLEEIFPKGLPVARVTGVGRSGASLFQLIHAAPMFAPLTLEEVALLFKAAAAQPAAPAAAAPAAPGLPGQPAAPAVVPPAAVAKPGRQPKTAAAIPPAPNQGGAPVATPAPAASGQPQAPAVQTGPPPAAPHAVQPGDAARKREPAAPADGTDAKKRRKPARPEGQ